MSQYPMSGENILFHEMYNVYYRIVVRLMEHAARAAFSDDDARKSAAELGFEETQSEFLTKLRNFHIPVFCKNADGTYSTPLEFVPRPLSLPERRWLASILNDERMRLFLDDEEIARLVSSLGGVKPLYDKEDFRVVDGANDPDPYASLHYRKIFRTLLDARERKKCLQIRYRARSGNKRNVTVEPTALQYSVKDDKFRLLCKGRHGDGRARRIVMNVSRIAAADICDASPPPGPGTEPETKTAVVSLSAERDTPERAMMHFANYECASYAREDGKIEMNIKYNAEDEKEVLVRALAFGPQIRVLAPDSLVNMIKERLTRQMKFFGTN